MYLNEQLQDDTVSRKRADSNFGTTVFLCFFEKNTKWYLYEKSSDNTADNSTKSI